MMNQTMRTILLLFVAMVCVLPRPVAADDPRWEVMPDLPVGVFNAAASVSGDGDRIVVTGGLTGLGQASNVVQTFDINAGAWSTPMTMTHGRHSHAQVTLSDGRVLIAGGETALLRDADAPLVTTIELLPANLASPSTLLTLDDGPMRSPTAHALPDGSAVVIGGARAVVIACDPLRVRKTIELHHGRRDHASAHMPDGRIVIVGGTGRNSIEVLDLDAGVSRLSSVRLPMALDDLGIAVVGPGRAWILCGQESRSGHTTDRTWLLTIEGDSEQLADGPRLDLADGVADHVVLDLGDRILVAGGESERRRVDTELSAAWLLDKSTLSVTRLPDMHDIHDDACGVVIGGRAWIIGGFAVQPAPFGLRMTVPVALRRVERLHLDAAPPP
jgi:hypothetical protein